MYIYQITTSCIKYFASRKKDNGCEKVTFISNVGQVNNYRFLSLPFWKVFNKYVDKRWSVFLLHHLTNFKETKKKTSVYHLLPFLNIPNKIEVNVITSLVV